MADRPRSGYGSAGGGSGSVTYEPGGLVVATDGSRGGGVTSVSTSGGSMTAYPPAEERAKRKLGLPTKDFRVKAEKEEGFFFVDGSHDFYVTKHNLIQCESCHKSSWCEHVKVALSKNLDAPQFWGQLQTVPEGQSEELDIPMVPSFNMWAKVSLIKADMPTPCYKVIFAIPTDGLKPGEAWAHEFIGFIHPGEGRFILRSMLFTWFLGHVKIGELACKYAHHKYAAEMSWQDDIKNPGKKMAQYWSVWSTGKCMFCGMGKPPDDSDLVPDAGSAKSYPR